MGNNAPFRQTACSQHRHWTVVIAVISVTVVQPSIDQIIEVITVRNERMPAAVVPALTRDGCAPVGVLGAYGNHVLVVMSLVRVVQMPIMEIVHMPVVKNAQMPAVFVVHVGMRIVNEMGHGKPPFVRQALQTRLMP